jgi:hypothetical protein
MTLMSEEADDLGVVGEAWSKRRIGLVLGALLLSLCALAYLIYYAICFHPKPSEAAVPTLLFIGLGALVVLLAPWRDLGLIPTEIAGVKFERIVNAQKKEQIAAIVPLHLQHGSLDDFIFQRSNAKRPFWGMATIRYKIGHLDAAGQIAITSTDFLIASALPPVHDFAICIK